MYHDLPDHCRAPLRNLDKNLNQYNALACNRDSGWDFQGSDMWRIFQGVPVSSKIPLFRLPPCSLSCRLPLPHSIRMASPRKWPPIINTLLGQAVSRRRQRKTASFRRPVAKKMAHPAACSARTF